MDDSETNMFDNSRPRWIVPMGVCFLLVIGCLGVVAIVFALIPLYRSSLSNNNANFDYTLASKGTIYMSYASNMALGRLLTLADTKFLSKQIVTQAGLTEDVLSLQLGNFISMTPIAPGVAKPPTPTISCEKPTGLTGDLFYAQFQLKYPPMLCYLSSCQPGFLQTVQNALRMSYHRVPVVMNFTDGQARNVQLKFCAFFKSTRV